MKIKEGFVLREIGGSPVVVAVGEGTKIFNGMIQLNETGALLWKELEKGGELSNLVDALTKEFNVKRDVAEKDAKEFIDVLMEANLLK